MQPMQPKELAIKLAKLEKESEIVSLLTNLHYWDDYSYWHPFGDNENNFSTIGNQQNKPDAALVEKFINSVDAILMKECLIRGIDMTGSEAPKNMSDALRNFFGIREGQISYLDANTRNKMSGNIILAATGNTRHLNLTIADAGEGQTPQEMPETILSLSKNNKLRVPFVQGKFNMGGTGVLPFCGKHRLQLVISKRCPDIPNTTNDRSFEEWSVTIVRREDAREGRRSSMFTYLTDKDGELLRFKAESLPIIPTPQDKPYEDMKYGTYFKLYDYAIKPYKANVKFDFYNRMSMLMPGLAHPIRIRECRPNYAGNSFEITLSGLQTRLLDDAKNNIEDGFPSSATFNVDGQDVRCSIYVFKKGKADNYRGKEGLLYVVNGQTQALVSDVFFNRINLSYLADSILVLVDCSEIDIPHREDMFMNSRDRLRDGTFVKEIESRLKEILKEHRGLKNLQYERRSAAVQKQLSNDKPLQNVLQSILKKSPVLSKILLTGTRLVNPFNLNANAGKGEHFNGKRHPTFFRLKGKDKNGILTKKVSLGHDFRVQFETDVDNDYFVRPDEQGQLKLTLEGIFCPELIKHLGLYNGIATLTIFIPQEAKLGEKYQFKAAIVDDCIPQELENEFSAVAIEGEAKDSTGKHNGKRTPPQGKNDLGNREHPDSVGMPNVEEVNKDRWEEFAMDTESALVIMTTDEGSDYYLNMDNKYLLTELKGIRD